MSHHFFLTMFWNQKRSASPRKKNKWLLDLIQILTLKFWSNNLYSIIIKMLAQRYLS